MSTYIPKILLKSSGNTQTSAIHVIQIDTVKVIGPKKIGSEYTSGCSSQDKAEMLHKFVLYINHLSNMVFVISNAK